MPVTYSAIGSEVGVNTAVIGSQVTPTVTRLSNGGYIVCWTTLDTAQDGSGSAVKAQVFDANGAPIGGEFLVNQSANGGQSLPSVAQLSDGNLIFTWTTSDTAQDGNGGAIKARILDVNGTAVVSEFLVNTISSTSLVTTTGTQTAPNVVALPNGGFVISWDNPGVFNNDIQARIFTNGGVPGTEFTVNNLVANVQSANDIAALSNGGFVAVWQTDNAADDGDGFAIKARIFDANGLPVAVEFRVNGFGTAGQADPSVIGLSNGNFVVVWETWDTSQDGSGYAIKGQIFSAAGAPVGSEFRVNTIAAGDQVDPTVTALDDGGFMVSWSRIQTSGVNRVNTFIEGQVFSSTGAYVGPQIQINQLTATANDWSSLATLGDGRVVAVWGHDSFNADGDGNGYGIRQRLLVPGGEPAPNTAPVITSNGGGATAQVSVAENGLVATTVLATDPEGRPIRYAIAGGADAARFTINSVTGVLSFVSSPNFESPSDANGDNVYDVIVSASDNELNELIDTQSIAVTVSNVNEAPVITSNGAGTSAAISLAENNATAAIVTAGDPENSTITYSISGGVDAARFTIDAATGVLAFISGPNFESPTDNGANNVYDVIVRASDGTLFDTQALAITVTNTNEAPVITSGGGGNNATVNVSENQTAVTTITSTDPENNPRTYSIAGGTDAARFAINATTGALSFVTAPNREAPTDSNLDNIYEVIVRASDGSLFDTQTIAVTVLNVNEAPVITSNGGGITASTSVAENSTFVTTVLGSDPENTPLTYSIVNTLDGARFTINSSTGVLSFISAPNREAPTDANGDNVYQVAVRASDGFFAFTQTISVTVTDVNEAPTITSNGGGALASISVAENSTTVTTVTSTDPENNARTYSISGGADAALFTIDSNTGLLAFITPPNFDVAGDSDGDNVYDVIVQASDGTLSDTQAIAVTVTNVNETPVLAATATASVVEGATAVTTIAASDPEGVALSYAISGGADSALFTIDAATGALSFVAAPDYEAPTDAGVDNVYDVIVTASDGVNVSTQSLAVSVTNGNEAPVITSNGGGAATTLAIAENGNAVTTVTATDIDGPTISFAIVGGADSALFTIDPVTGALSFIAAPNFEAAVDAGSDNVYDVIVEASDGSLVDSQALAISVTNINEAVSITSNGGGASAAVSVVENSSAVTTVNATDVDGDAISYAIAGGADAALFTIDSATGALNFANVPNFEAPADADGDNVYDVIVSASDGLLLDTQSLQVTVVDANEAPVIAASASATITENNAFVALVSANDPENTPLSYAITGGADASLFAIDAVTGALSFAGTPDFETPTDVGADNIYDVVITASDGSDGVTQSLTITVSNIDEAPMITSNGGTETASLSVSENAVDVTTVTSTDPEGNPRSYSIIGGADAARFTINATTGVLAFVNAPNFEAPSDVGADNVYDVIVQASDGVLVDTQTLAVTVTNVNEAPTIISNGGGATAVISVNENSLAVATVTASDVEGTTSTYSIIGGADAARFTINASTGVLSFVSAPNFEAPTDAGANNIYDVIVQASDGTLVDTQAIAVAVNNLVDGATIVGTNTVNTLIGTNAEDTIDGRGGNDTITGGLGSDRLTGGTGADRFTYTATDQSMVGAADVITDFSRSQNDRIVLSGIDANVNTANDQAFSFIGTAAFSNVAGQLRYQQISGNTFISGDVNGDGVADFMIQVNGNITFQAGDFVL